jgi:hypothetical protein
VALTVGSYYRRVPVKARHYSLDVVAIEGVEITLDQFFLGRHFSLPPVCQAAITGCHLVLPFRAVRRAFTIHLRVGSILPRKLLEPQTAISGVLLAWVSLGAPPELRQGEI